jgi:signal transduction histidine kinase
MNCFEIRSLAGHVPTGLFSALTVREVSHAFIDGDVRRRRLEHCDNAIIYPRRNELRGAESEGSDFIGISVTDSGQGIPAEEQERVFKKYYRSPRTSSVNGTGLGLAIVSAVAKAHGGKVELKSEVDKGSAFTLLLPL